MDPSARGGLRTVSDKAKRRVEASLSAIFILGASIWGKQALETFRDIRLELSQIREALGELKTKVDIHEAKIEDIRESLKDKRR